jgi:hypothetical protein
MILERVLASLVLASLLAIAWMIHWRQDALEKRIEALEAHMDAITLELTRWALDAEDEP